MKTLPLLEQTTRYTLVPVSGNSKTGPIPVVSADRASCPSRCPFYNDGEQICYGQEFRITKKWDGIAEKGDTWPDLVGKLRATIRPERPWRFGIVGDLPTDASGNLDAGKLEDLRSLRGDGWAYTHHNVLTSENFKTVRALHAKPGFIVNQSADTLEQAEACLDAGIPTVMVGPANFKKPRMTERGSILTPCPASLSKGRVTCADCRLCRSGALARTARRIIIVFPAHGPRSKKTAEQVTVL
jgi:hypothetical protein